jgi:hypothetical protein
MESPVVVLTYRNPAIAGMVCAEIIPDPVEARRRSVDIAEFAGACDVHEVAHSDRVVHSRAVPHARIPLDPEVLLQAMRDGV